MELTDFATEHLDDDQVSDIQWNVYDLEETNIQWQ